MGAEPMESEMSAEDRAQDQELAMWEITQRSAKMASYAPEDPRYGPALCRQFDCGEPISEARRAMGKHHCVECTETLERLKKLGR
jgi:RNA polymerase-binding transcription factor DksA